MFLLLVAMVTFISSGVTKVLLEKNKSVLFPFKESILEGVTLKVNVLDILQK